LADGLDVGCGLAVGRGLAVGVATGVVPVPAVAVEVDWLVTGDVLLPDVWACVLVPDEVTGSDSPETDMSLVAVEVDWLVPSDFSLPDVWVCVLVSDEATGSDSPEAAVSDGCSDVISPESDCVVSGDEQDVSNIKMMHKLITRAIILTIAIITFLCSIR
jgi:hypothetical protein